MKKEWKNLKTVTWKKGELDFTSTDKSVIEAHQKKVVENLTNDKRLRAVLDYVADFTYTHTLAKDTYPIEINKEALIDGTIFLTLSGSSGHTLIVSEVNTGEGVRLPLYTLHSTVPKEVRPLTELPFFESSQPQRGQGFVRFRWPLIQNGKMSLVDNKSMPYFSEEQYSQEFMIDPTAPAPEKGSETYSNFGLMVYKRINPNFNPALRITEGLATLDEMISQRIEVVKKGYDFCVVKNNNCKEGTAAYEDWSTPSRDKRLLTLINDMEAYAQALFSFDEVQKKWNEALDSKQYSIEGQSYLMRSLHWSWRNKFFSSNPTSTIDERWGLSPQFFAQRVVADLSSLFVERAQKIKENVCRFKDCPLFSEMFDRNSSFAIDAQVREVYDKFNLYCTEFSAQNCVDFKNTLGQIPTPISSHSSMNETWQLLPVINSDPRVSEGSRWGKNSDLAVLARFEGNFNSVASSNSGYDLLKTSYPIETTDSYKELISYYVVDRINGQTQAKFKEISDKNPIFIHPSQPLLARIKTGEIEITDVLGQTLSKGQAPQFDAEGVYGVEVFWMNHQRLAIYSSHNETLSVYNYSSQNLKSETSFENVSSASSSDSDTSSEYLAAYFQNTKDQTVRLLLVKNTEIAEMGFDISKLNIANPSSIHIVLELDGHFLARSSAYVNDKYVSHIFGLDTRTGKIKIVDPSFDNYNRVFRNLFFTTSYEQDAVQTTLFFVDREWNIQKTLKLPPGTSCVNCYDIGRSSIKLLNLSDESKSELFSLDFNKMAINKVAAFNDPQLSVADTNNDLMIAIHNETSQSVIVDLRTGQALLTAHQVNFGLAIGDSNPNSPYVTLARGINLSDTKNVYQYVTLDRSHFDAPSIFTQVHVTDSSHCLHSECEGGDVGIATGPIQPYAGTVLQIFSPLEVTETPIAEVNYVSPNYNSGYTLMIPWN